MFTFKPKLVLTLFFICFSFIAISRDYFKDRPDFFKQNLQQKKYGIDTNASAIILYESCEFFQEAFLGTPLKHVRKVIKILDNKGLAYGDVSVLMQMAPGHKPDFNVLHATTYKLEDGKVATHDLNEKDISYVTLSDYTFEGKFSLPAVQEGCIVDYEYTVKEKVSSGVEIGNWYFQSNLPKLYSRVLLIAPELKKTSVITHVRNKFAEFDDNTDNIADTSLPETFTSLVNERAGFINRHWVRRNITAYEKEPFVSDIRNYIEQINFQSAINVKGEKSVWKELNDGFLYRNTLFGELHDTPPELIRKTATLIANIPDSIQMAKAIYRYVRDSFTVTKRTIGTYNKLDKVFSDKKGNTTDIDMVLIEMLRSAGFESCPVILSTKENLKLSPVYPEFNRINYAVCELKAGGQQFYLDPTKKYNSFGLLPEDCYNGFSWALTDSGRSISLEPSMLKERSAVIVRTDNADENNYTVSVKKYFGATAGSLHRSRWAKDTAAIKNEINEELKKIQGDYKLVKYQLFNLNNPDTVLILDYVVETPWFKSNTYFTPSMLNIFDTNPFKDVSRIFPVEMPYAQNYTFALTLDLPKSFTIDDTLKSIAFKLDEDDTYRYTIDYSSASNRLSLTSKLDMAQTNYGPEAYGGLRAFFDKMIEQQQTTILIKKKS